MYEPSQLLTKAENVCTLFHEVIKNVTENEANALKALLRMYVAVNELAEEVNKGKELLAQVSKLKQEIVGKAEGTAQETAQSLIDKQKLNLKATQDGQAPIDPAKLAAEILKNFNLPADLIPKVDKGGQD